MLAHLYDAKLRRIAESGVVVFNVDLGFGISIDVRVKLHGVKLEEGAEDYIYDWLIGHDAFVVKTIRTENDTYYGYVYSDRQLTACLNDDLVDSGRAVSFYMEW